MRNKHKEKMADRRKLAEEEREKLLHDAGVKELQCMYDVAESVRTRTTLEEVFQDVAEFIPPGWQYPEITRGKVIFDGKEYVSEPFEETRWKQSSGIIVNGEPRGSIEAYYLEECPELDEGPFLTRERNLINGVTRFLGEAVERRRVEEALRKARDELGIRVEERTADLAQANKALRAERAERKRAEDALRDSEERLRLRNRIAGDFLTVPGDAAFSIVLRRILEASESQFGVFGYIDEDGAFVSPSMTRDIWDKCKVPDKRNVFPRDTWGDSLWCRAIREKRTLYSNNPSRVPEGHLPVSRNLAVPIISEGKVLGLIHIANKATDYGPADVELLEDTTAHIIAPILEARILRSRQEEARKRAEHAVRRSEADYRALVEHATYGIYRSSTDGEFLAVNPALVEMLGYETEEELLAVRMDRDVYRDAEAREDLIARYGHAERIDGVEVEWRRKDGSPLTVRLSGRTEFDQRRGIECFEMIAEDVTEQRKLEAHLQQAQKMEAVGKLTSGIAHDFNNILTVILTNAEMVAGDLPEGMEGLHTDLDELRAAARRGAEMVKKLLGFSRHDRLTVKPVDLRQVVSEMTLLLKRLLPEYIEIQVIADEPVGTVLADPGVVERILINLATNARDAMPDGGTLTIDVRQVELDLSSRETHPWVVPGEYVCVAVRDTGQGMDEETKEHIFEPFYTTKPKGEGTGLGMPMVYGLVKQHGGFVHVYSEVGEGTEVKLYFPVTRGETDTVKPAPAHQAGLPVGTETLLVVEDEKVIRRASVRALECHGYSVLEAKNGEEALEVFRAHESEIALVISDLVMPKLGGRQLYEALRQQGKKVRFLFTSGYSAAEVDEGTLLEPEIPLLHKPWPLADLLARVRETLDQGASS